MPGDFRFNASAPKGRVYVDIQYTCDFEQVDGDSVEKYPMMGYWSHWSRGFKLPMERTTGTPHQSRSEVIRGMVDGQVPRRPGRVPRGLGTDGGSVSLKLQRRTRR